MGRASITNLINVVTLIVTKVVTIIAVAIIAGIRIYTIRIGWACMSSIFAFVIFDTFCAGFCRWISVFISPLFKISISRAKALAELISGNSRNPHLAITVKSTTMIGTKSIWMAVMSSE